MSEIGINYGPETCAYCKGRGTKPNCSPPCSVCNGQGSILVALPARKCAYCNGRGTKPNYSPPCTVCGGTGWSHAMR